MSVLLSLLVVICGLLCAFCFITGGTLYGFVFLAITLLAIAGLASKVVLQSKFMKNDSVKTESIKTISKSTKSETEQLKEYKELLDSGAITQEEYDAKKKQILGL